ncbi:phosphatase PAP2 family protein [Pedobacter sp. HMF7647]|uniref:Phosphatase PAP2 family protein n=1 Tax=Hufsiella arboris TaxID=2695275 RepID=A0A7K1YED0_9SPHI|nr:vanadium-dependent haloperoxidase [Hufsiella arboris]MXV52389.1 phosphatase PAP2 family protein [Hufsiella arboris]
MKFSPFFLLVILCLNCCKTNDWKKESSNPEFLHRSVKLMTDVMVHDIYSPPVASRTYAYINIAGYEAAIHDNPAYRSLAGQAHGLTAFPQPDKNKKYAFQLAAVNAILTVGKTMVLSEGRVDQFKEQILNEFKETGMPDEVFNNSLEFGNQVAQHVIKWSKSDNYKQTRSLPKYTVKDDSASWKPTPPGYMRAVEPHWNKIRTFIIDSAQQFKPTPPFPFSMDKSSPFYHEVLDVYHVVAQATSLQTEIANFWDCNPFKLNINGHVMYASKKISPGGHWINITRLACKRQNADFVRSAEAYARLSITLADAFIGCWHEKYRSKAIRPETVINQYIDQKWAPLLQTPPFPEYTSGHSVISAASAVVLAKLFGNNFAFTDSTETEFKLPPRKFKSFDHAAQEAAISRFYGGIHYMSSIRNGLSEGNEIGLYISQRLNTRSRNTDIAVLK